MFREDWVRGVCVCTYMCVWRLRTIAVSGEEESQDELGGSNRSSGASSGLCVSLPVSLRGWLGPVNTVPK